MVVMCKHVILQQVVSFNMKLGSYVGSYVQACNITISTFITFDRIEVWGIYLCNSKYVIYVVQEFLKILESDGQPDYIAAEIPHPASRIGTNI